MSAVAALAATQSAGSAPGPTRALKILLVNDYGRASGGAELQMLALRDGLRARGHQVRLLTSDATLVEGFPLLADTACTGRTDRRQILLNVANRSATRALRHELHTHPPDLVHIRMFLWQLSPLILSALGDVPTMFQPAVYKAICPNGMKLLPDGSLCHYAAGRACLRNRCVTRNTWVAAMAQLALLRRTRRNIDAVFPLSRTMVRLMEENGWSVAGTLPNGVDERAMRPPLPPRPVIGYAGRLSREKGVETFIDACLALAPSRPELTVLVAGTGPLEAALKSRAAPLGERIRFLGHLDRAAMEAAFDPVWVQVVPSLWHEPFGNVSTEAMMRGTAVVAADVGGQSDIVRNGRTGYLVPPGDVATLADRLELIVDDHAHAESLGAEGRKVAQSEYSRRARLDDLEAAYQKTIRAFEQRHHEGGVLSHVERA